VRILAIADELTPGLLGRTGPPPDVVVSCGDLPWDELERVVDAFNVPLVFVPGNHDPALVDARPVAGAWPVQIRHADLDDPPGPRGGTNLDGRIVDVAGVRFAGLGGSVRYREGPNQYSQPRFATRARRLADRALLRRLRDGRRVDVLVSHAPPRGLGDDDDPAHQGIEALHTLVRRLRPRLLLHGHIHPFGIDRPDRMLGETRVVNVVPYKVLELEPHVARRVPA
jgi:Icc-related predicted phosphoesterase